MSAYTPHNPDPLTRPTLLPGLHRFWRSRHRLQLGLDPARAVVLELTDPRAVRVLDLLDGSRSHRAVIADAHRHGVPEQDAANLINDLRQAGIVVGAQTLLPHNLPTQLRRRLSTEAAALALRGTDAPATPAQILRRRATAKIAIAGGGPLATPVAVALAQAGVGHVAAQQGRDHHRNDADLCAIITQHAPGTHTRRLRREETTFEIQTTPTGPATLTAAGYARRRLAHLALGVRDGAVVVGPLVPPAGVPCLNCLDLHRKDRDPEWPALAAQLTAAPVGPCANATVLTAAGLAATEVLNWIDGGSARTLGASVEITADGQWRRRRWQPHPECDCVRRARRRRLRR